MDTLEEALLKSNLYIERYSPQSQILISKNLDKAYKEIATLVSTTTNKAKIKAEVNRIMNEVFYYLPDEVVKDMIEISDVSYTATSAIMQSYVSAELAGQALKFKDIREATIQRLESPTNLIQGHSLQEHFKHLNATATHKIQGQILKGFSDGLGIDEINRGILSSIANVDRNQSKTLIRTSLLEATQASQLEAYKAFEKEIISYTYSSKIDSRTSSVCLTQDGITHKKILDFSILPKNHYNCRSVLVPNTEYSKALEDDRILTQQDGRTVNHRDGTKSTKFTVASNKVLPKDVSGVDALKFMDDKYLKNYLGSTRYNLYKSGKADLKDMFNISRGKLLTLDVLKSRLNI